MALSQAKTFRVNNYLTVRLENGVSNIYIRGMLFNQCKYLLLNLNRNDIRDYDPIESIDDALPGVGLDTINSRLQKYGGIRGLRRTLRAPILQNLLASQLDDFTISDILFVEMEEIERLTLKLWGMTSDRARRFFNSHYLGHFDYDNII